MNNIPVEDFLRPFFEVSDKICLRIFADRKNETMFRGVKLETSLTGIEKIMELLEQHNAANRGIFFVVNTGGHEDSQITKINAQFMEIDDGTFEEQWAKINAFPIEPSIVVKTRKSLHTYWLVRNADTAMFRPIQKALAQHFGGDPMCVNESRVMRIPGFYHCKAEPVMVECMKYNPELRYTQEELREALPDVEGQVHTVAAAPKGDRLGLDSVLRRCDFMKYCTENASDLGEHDWYAMITNLAVFDGGEKAIHALSKMYPRYKADETDEKIRHFMASGTKPITCTTIAEKGFRCPRLADGSCTCKAPAALCYQPMTLNEMRIVLSGIQITHDVVADAQAAREFIGKALYNVDPVDASVFIDNDIRDHFKLKTQETNRLISHQKALYREYNGRHDTRRAASGDELPEWYEISERGGVHFLPGILAERLTEDVNAFFGAGRFYSYESGVYCAKDDLWASREVVGRMIPRYTTINTVNDASAQWKVRSHRDVKEINPNPFILNLRNGLLNVLDGSFRDHTPEYISTVQIGASFHPELREAEDYGCPVFMTFLHSILGDPEIRLLQEIFGYLLIPVNKAQKSFVFVGAPNAGKSTLLNVAQEILLGPENVSNIPWQALGDRFNKAELFGKLANIFADLPSKSMDDNGMFKALTGEDYVNAERKNKDPFSFRPYARFLFSCNEIPRNYGDRSDGFYRRLTIIRFAKSVPPEKRDVALKEKLAAEADGILMWALDGLNRLMGNGYHFSETALTRAESNRYKTESSSSLSFADEYLEADPGAVVFRNDIYEAYKRYCMDTGFRPLSQIGFNRDIESVYSGISRAKDRVTKRNTWCGIRYYPEGKDI